MIPLTAAPALEVTGLACGYGAARVLTCVSLTVEVGQVVAILGRNGAGKTTLVNTVMGLLPPHAGRIRVHGQDTTNAPTWRIARHGVALVPQGRRVFAPLTVAEHLALVTRPDARWTPDTVLELLPALRSRLTHRGDQLSGGEQQMLALARALLTNPSLLLLDEPTEGLAPLIAAQVGRTLRHLAGTGTTILIAEQNAAVVADLADRSVLLAAGTLATRHDRTADPTTVPHQRTRPLGPQ
jgi:branched-chain amino acid transport system ATP-binding protein